MHTSSLLSFVFLASVGLSLFAVRAQPGHAVELEIGKPFPEIWLPLLENGEPTSTKHWLGEKVILHVFASW